MFHCAAFNMAMGRAFKSVLSLRGNFLKDPSSPLRMTLTLGGVHAQRCLVNLEFGRWNLELGCWIWNLELGF